MNKTKNDLLQGTLEMLVLQDARTGTVIKKGRQDDITSKCKQTNCETLLK